MPSIVGAVAGLVTTLIAGVLLIASVRPKMTVKVGLADNHPTGGTGHPWGPTLRVDDLREGWEDVVGVWIPSRGVTVLLVIDVLHRAQWTVVSYRRSRILTTNN